MDQDSKLTGNTPNAATETGVDSATQPSRAVPGGEYVLDPWYDLRPSSHFIVSRELADDDRLHNGG